MGNLISDHEDQGCATRKVMSPPFARRARGTPRRLVDTASFGV